MSEPIPESIPTSSDRRSQRPTKKRALTPSSAQSNQIEALFAHPDRSIPLPASREASASALARRATQNAPPEIVANVQGSSAGAGSGEFHVYKASRRREYERLRAMDEEVRTEEKEREWVGKREEQKKRDEAKTNRNKARREKAKSRRDKGKGKDGGTEDGVGKENVVASGGVKKVGPRPVPAGMVEEDEEDQAGEGGEVLGVEETGIIIHDED